MIVYPIFDPKGNIRQRQIRPEASGEKNTLPLAKFKKTY